MVSTFTPNKNLELPAHADYVNSWEIPVNADFTGADTAFGGSSLLNSTGLSGDTALTSTQYRPLSLLISGTPVGTITYVVPANVGGQWVFANGTAGGQTVGIKSAAGGSTFTAPAGTSILVSCDGSASGMRRSISDPAVAAGATGQIQYYASGVLGATAGLTWTTASATSATGLLSVTGAISASGPITSTTGGFVFPDATVQRTAAPRTGVVDDYIGVATAPDGAVFANGTTIGNASSNATGRANVDTLALFALIWNSLAAGQAPIFTSGGVLTTRGANAAADFAANKAISTPDLRGMLVAGMDTNGGIAAAGRLTTSVSGATAGATGGTQTHTLVIAEMPAHGHDLTAVSPGAVFDGGSSPGSLALAGQTTTSTGGGGAHNNTQPTMVLSKIIWL